MLISMILKTNGNIRAALLMWKSRRCVTKSLAVKRHKIHKKGTVLVNLRTAFFVLRY